MGCDRLDWTRRKSVTEGLGGEARQAWAGTTGGRRPETQKFGEKREQARRNWVGRERDYRRLCSKFQLNTF